MATNLVDLRERLAQTARSLADRDPIDEAVAILSETADHERLTAAVVNAGPTLHDAIAAEAAGWLLPIMDDELVPFEAGYVPLETQSMYLATDDVPMLIATIPALEPPDRGDQFDLDDFVASRVRGYSYSFESEDGWVHFFRRLTRSNFHLERHKGVLARFVDNQYELVSERGIRLDTDFDAAVVGDIVVVRRRQSFERLFGFAQLTMEHAAESARAVVAHLTINGADDFVKVVSEDMRMHSKLMSARDKMRDEEYKAKVTDESIADLVDKRTDVDLDVLRVDGSIELVFDSAAQRRWTLLKILDDDYLISELTDSRYQAPSKQSGSD